MTGERGDRGPQGDRGDRGQQGDTGDHGHHGVSGDTGKHGATGDTGDTGKQGVPGETGRLPIVLAGVLLAVLLALTAITFLQVQRIGDFTENLREANVLACERSNALRQAFYNNTQTDVRARKAAAAGFSGQPARDLLAAAQAGERDLARIVAASADVAKETGGVAEDCGTAFPEPD